MDDEGLKELENSLCLLPADTEIAVLSVMGAYRTGKSFLLDLILKYLKHVEGGPATNEETPPHWLTGRIEKEIAFKWRGGMEKCTEGIWAWTEVFLLSDPLQDAISTQSIAVILIDTQGAWDSRMSKSESSTIFGLTAAISSFLIYNVSMQIQEDKVENLHYFLECASAAMRKLGDEGDGTEPRLEDCSPTETAAFQTLEFLVRDWPNFEENFTISDKIEQAEAHLKQHLDDPEIREVAAAKAVRSMFSKVGCCLLSHPGQAIPKPGWTGEVSDLSADFVESVDSYFRDRLFSCETLNPKKVMGRSVTPEKFPVLLKTFVSAFEGLVPDATNLATAVARSAHLLSRDAAVKNFRNKIENLFSDSPTGLEEDQLKKRLYNVRALTESEFSNATQFGPAHERVAAKLALDEELDRIVSWAADENKRRTEKALTVFAGIAVLAVTLWLIDRLSDVACDWYSETCRRASAGLFAAYSLAAAIVLAHAVGLWRKRGQLAATVALMEMGKSGIQLVSDLWTECRAAWAEDGLWTAAVVAGRFCFECWRGLVPVLYESFQISKEFLSVRTTEKVQQDEQEAKKAFKQMASQAVE